MHYCQNPKHKQWILCDIKDLTDIKTWTYTPPYDSFYSYDSIQVGKTIYFTGGGTPSSQGEEEKYYQTAMKVIVMDDMKTVVESLASINVPRAEHRTESIANKYLYILGGINSDGIIAACEEYEIEADKWKEIAPLNEKKKWVSVCSFNEKYLYTFGGCLANKGDASSLIECLDTSSPTAWVVIKVSAEGSQFVECYLLGAVAISETSILLFGGIVKGKEVDQCMRFDVVEKKLVKEKALLCYDSFCRTQIGFKDNSFAVVGSREGGLHIYDKGTQKWSYKLRKIWNAKGELQFKSDTI
jgi:hypothetical protein